MAEDIALMAHLMRRAGFGATREELEARAERGYDATVAELLAPDSVSPAPTATSFCATIPPSGSPLPRRAWAPPPGSIPC